ncbi:hypothetical protein ACFVYV_47030 [Streptomyces mirabilis]|uniref:hypothetical protein n=1 Tax=Streptomyces mirabilis TaxID=68239 RepID=UPI0036DCE293
MLEVLVFDTLPGLFIGIGVSLLLLLHRSSRPVVSELGEVHGNGHFAALAGHPERRRIAGVPVLRPRDRHLPPTPRKSGQRYGRPPPGKGWRRS